MIEHERQLSRVGEATNHLAVLEGHVDVGNEEARSDNPHKERSKRYFDKIADRYDLSFAGRHSAALLESVLNRLSQEPFDSFLDVGCGTGNLLAAIAETEEGVGLSGIDISPGMIAVAKRKLDGLADLRVGDSEKLPWADGTFDVVVTTDSFHHYPRPIGVLAEIKRVLRPNGLLIVADPWWPTPVRQLVNLSLPFLRYGDVRVYSEKAIRRILVHSGFDAIRWERVGQSGYILTALATRDLSIAGSGVHSLRPIHQGN